LLSAYDIMISYAKISRYYSSLPRKSHYICFALSTNCCFAVSSRFYATTNEDL